MEEGYLAIVLHAHLPFVRHPEHEYSLEENWLFEAITETYLPLFLVLEDLIADGIDFRLSFSVTPTLASMLGDPFLQSRYLTRLERQIELAEKEVARTRSDPSFEPLARMYRALFARVREAFVERYSRDLLAALRRFQELGKVELIGSAATHGYLPLLLPNESSVRTQVRVGVEQHRRIFGRQPNGFWLPECGYVPGLDALLHEQGIRFTLLETHGITRADQRPRYGVHAPLYCPSGLAAFGRDPDTSRQVWSSIEGYPGDFDYREFYRDIGFDLDADYIRPYVHPDGIRIDTGIKYYRITGKDDYKEPYVPERAERKAERHAGHFLSERLSQVDRLLAMMDRKPLIVAPYDAELFGHWWFEGPRWLDYLIRKIALEQKVIRLVTLSEYLDEYPVNQTAQPCMSSWGHEGFSNVWLNHRNQWIYPHLHMGAELMEKLVASHPRAEGMIPRAVDQAARELLLAQASDWAFMINSGAMEEYASARTRRHLLRFHRIREQVENGAIDEAWLEKLEAQDNIFPGINLAKDFRARDPVPLSKVRGRAVPAVAEPPSSPIHVVMVSPEIVPFAKTGGLGEMVGSLAVALEKLGARVSLVMPAYRQVFQKSFRVRDTGIRLSAPVAGRAEGALVLSATIGKQTPVYLIRSDRYFDREYLYGTPEGDYADNAERFVWFSRVALELLRALDTPHVLHAHDWQAAPAVAFLKAQPERYPGLAGIRTIFAVHNLGYQGLFASHEWKVLGLDGNLFTPDGLEFHGMINLLKGGILFADTIVTVSPTYAREICSEEYGFGLEGVLRRRSRDLVGILNGVDYETWNPAADRFLAKVYSPVDLSGKYNCKADLQRTFGLPVNPDTPLLGMVSRLAAQKGFDLLEAVMDQLLRKDLQLVLLGSGDRRYQDWFSSAAARYADKLGIRIAFEEGLAHKIEAGADMFLMPSRYEPSGLNQLYSLKYGTIPIVRATGGLKDSIQEFDPLDGTGNGFTFQPYDSDSLLDAVDRALAAYRQEDSWAKLMRNAMAADHSWSRSAREYLGLYEGLLGLKRT
jgi:1,4-alpha-glucan branching enzyme